MSEFATICRPMTLQDCHDGTRLTSCSSDLHGTQLISALLASQQDLSAVDLFSRDHDRGTVPEQSRYYSKLMPASRPGPGQQYAFEVDLDRCSGCKACVTGCHARNGLDDRETWRDVGLLIGGTTTHPVMQHVTTACHHCLQPACLSACPVNAYEKDPVTGIVRHLDDQCFGCQYCTLACPYEVPKYHQQKGVVRKCDMCSNRLEKGEAPACVQSCPHEAISIRIVEVAQVKENAEADNFLPAAPEPHLTFPTTHFKTSKVFPRNLLPVDYHSISPQHPHWPLIIMLVLTQLSVGAFATGCILEHTLDSAVRPTVRPFLATSALGLALIALAASTLHLGRPQYAFRGILGLRHSWLSREILAFGIFSHLAIPYALLSWLVMIPGFAAAAWTEPLRRWLPVTGDTVAVTGILGVYCSAMIYVFTRREFWSLERTMIRFGLTSAILGISTTWLSLTVMRLLIPPETGETLLQLLTPPLAQSLMIFSGLKIAFDLLLLRHLSEFRSSPLKRSALLVTGVLSRYSLVRLLTGALGGILVPWLALDSTVQSGALSITGSFGLALGAWVGCLLGEMFERYLFFAAVSAPRMPGGVRQ